MRVATHISFAASRKEPLAQLLDRVRQAFLDAGLPEATIRFTLSDSPLKKGVSAVSRVLKRHPEMERFLAVRSLIPGGPEVRLLSNAATGEAVESLQAIAAGVPRAYPCSGVAMHFHAPVFGERLIGLPKMSNSLPGVMVTDNWWINGRPPVDAVIKACGKVKRTEQVPILAPGGGTLPSLLPANAEAVKAIVADYRTRIRQLVERAALPHNLLPASEIRLQNPGVMAGPRKPALEGAFKPMGYRCRGRSGEFHLTRRTPGNLTMELYLDVGTWSHEVSAMFLIEGAGFKASLAIPVAPVDVPPRQYPIGDAAQWQKIVENLAAMVREIERSFVPEIEQAAGPSPEWYQPAS